MQSTTLTPNLARLQQDWDELAALTEPQRPYTRRAFTPLYQQARIWLAQRMAQAGLTVRVDAAGNLIGRREGTRPDLPPLLLGSHIDTVPAGGRFDGIIGVTAALEVARLLQAEGITLAHPLEVADFLSEEPSDYGVSTVGSRGMVGTLTPAMLAQQNPAGETLAAAITRMGGDPMQLTTGLRRRGDVAGYLELHIEQGPVLERERVPVGVVTGLVGIRRWNIVVTGEPGHAGTTPMALRKDALAAAAQLVLGVEAVGRDEPGAVATVGRLNVSPNAANIVPGRVDAVAEFRASSVDALARMVAAFQALGHTVAAQRGVQIDLQEVSTTAPVAVAPEWLTLLEAALADTEVPVVRLVSGAGHDANQLATIAPTGMFFIPSRLGLSHCPEEWSDMADVAVGTRVLAAALLRLDRSAFI